MTAIQESVQKIGRFKLPESTLYVTLEPCPMCAGAILQARVGTVVYAAKNPLLGDLLYRCQQALMSPERICHKQHCDASN